MKKMLFLSTLIGSPENSRRCKPTVINAWNIPTLKGAAI